MRRYLNILGKKDVDSRDVLLLTFTRNAAEEMKERVDGQLASGDYGIDGSKYAQTSTFDSFCNSIIRDHPESIGEYLGLKDTISKGAVLSENETLNKQYFINLFDRFILNRGDDYGMASIVASQNQKEMYGLINKLMSKGIIPSRKGWFRDLTPYGDVDEARRLMGRMEFNKVFSGKVDQEIDARREVPEFDDALRDGRVLDLVCYEDRDNLMRLVHDVYFEYMRRSALDDRLTFGLVSTFALIALYTDKAARERLSCRYLMIDEFQDTNENQFMISLMLLKEPNLCVVGDWKQGIYGFRFATIENITNFENVVRRLHSTLDDHGKMQFDLIEPIRLSLDVNYRSSQLIIDEAYSCLTMKASKDEPLDVDEVGRNTVNITAGRDDIGDNSQIDYIQAITKEDEISEVIGRIENYVNSGRYVICEGDVVRSPDYGDIAVLCRNRALCRLVDEAASLYGVPHFLQGDVEVMNTREGKLLLAWLRYLSNEHDPRGLNIILGDMNYSLITIKNLMKNGVEHFEMNSIDQKYESMVESSEDFGLEGIKRFRKGLLRKKRRVTSLITEIFSYYGLNNDVTQTIISILSSSHRNSLLTISDMIKMIEDDIEGHTKYSMDGNLGRSAVTIQTMHGSKGLEYPIVIVPGLNLRSMPPNRKPIKGYAYNDLTGIRCSENVVGYGDGFYDIRESWRFEFLKEVLKNNYDEERRLMFVAISRAKQYVSLICNNPSQFFKGLVKGEPQSQLDAMDFKQNHDEIETIDPPKLGEFIPRMRNIGVHDILDFSGDRPENFSEGDERGMEFGTRIHRIAHRMALGAQIEENEIPQISAIRNILESVQDADLILPEIPCTLPLKNEGVILRGVIDLLTVHPGKVTIHDYKTDMNDRFEGEYIIQLSTYAHSAKGFYKKDSVECKIHYVSMGMTKSFEPLPLEAIRRRVSERI